MPSVQVEDVPAETHAVLRRRAAAAHQYLRSRLIADAAQPTLDEVLARIGGESGGVAQLDTVVADLRANLEVASVVRRQVRGAVPPERARRALLYLTDLPLARYRHRDLLGRGWELRDAVSTYDAAYVALAEVVSATLLTADARLARAPGTRCPVEVVS